MSATSRVWRPQAGLVTCEHASNAVPESLRSRFRGCVDILSTHRAWDPGGEELAVAMARRLSAPLLLGRYTRLAVDLNRSIDSSAAFSEFTRGLSPRERARLAASVWAPFRAEAEGIVDGFVHHRRRVLHLSAHTMTPVLNGERRDMDVAWLYDPRRSSEVGVVNAWMRTFRKLRPELRLARNRPYKGTDDGHTSSLRTRFPARAYAGIELEFNHGLLRRGDAFWRRLCDDAAEACATAIDWPF